MTTARKLGTHSRRRGAGLDARALAVGRRAGGARSGCGARGVCARRAPATSPAARPCSPCSSASCLTFRIVHAEQRIHGVPAQARAHLRASAGVSGIGLHRDRGLAVSRGGLSALAAPLLDRRRAVFPCARHGELDRRAAPAPQGSLCRAPISGRRVLDRLAARLRLSRPVTLLESCLAEVPVVIGYFAP